MSNNSLLQYLADRVHSISVEFNPHRGNFQSIDEYVGEHGDNDDFLSEADRQLCIDNNAFVHVVIYSRTTISHCDYFGSSLEMILQDYIDNVGLPVGFFVPDGGDEVWVENRKADE